MPFSPATSADTQHMLKTIGVDSVDDLFAELPNPVDETAYSPELTGLSELELMAKARSHARNTIDFGGGALSFLGMGSWDHFVPAVCRAIPSRSEFATSYTPYQPEISQGTLQAIFEFQSSIAALTGLPVANASLYDGATAAAEAVYLAEQTTRRSRVVVLETVSPRIRAVLDTYARTYGMTVDVVKHETDSGTTSPEKLAAVLGDDVAAVLIQQPNAFGCLEDAPKLVELANGCGSVSIVHAEALSLGVLEAPGAYGAGVVVGEGQPLGLAPTFGGPTFGFMAAQDRFIRRLPGRIVGETVDTEGRRGYVLTLQTREQHIRREKATSNICTNQALCALTGLIYLSWLGPNGMRDMGELLFDRAAVARDSLTSIAGVKQIHSGTPFRDFVVELPVSAQKVIDHCAEEDILIGIAANKFWPSLNEGALLVAVTEQRTAADIDRLRAVITSALSEVSA